MPAPLIWLGLTLLFGGAGAGAYVGAKKAGEGVGDGFRDLAPYIGGSLLAYAAFQTIKKG